MQFLREKLQLRIDELRRYRFCDMQSIFPMQGSFGGNHPDDVYTHVPEHIGDFAIEKGFTVEGRDRYFWSQKKIQLPPAREGYDVCGLFVMGQYGHLIGAETMCFVDRGLYQGVDQNHEEVIFNAFAGQEIELSLLTWTGMEGKEPPLSVVNRVERADIGYLWKPADDLFYALKAALQTIEVLSEYDMQRVQLQEIVEATLKLLNWDQDKICETIPTALAYFLSHMDGMQKLPGGVAVDVVGATHIDVAWVWRLKHTREKAMRSFSTVMRLMDEFPEYVFMQSQPQLYKYIKEDQPALYEQIKQRVAEGRWEADGGMWLEADCNISSGESLIRQFLHGINFFREEFHAESTYLWLPDVFGYSWSLPQILKGCGIKTFATTKIGWNQFNTMPHDLFHWRGIDGTDIMTFLLTSAADQDDGQGKTPLAVWPPRPEKTLDQAIADRHSSYNTSLTARSELITWLKFREKEYTRTALIPYGHGDGGGGTTRGMIKTRRMLDKMPGLPEARNIAARQFFEDLHKDVEASGKPLPIWDGELYLEFHRGTYTTQAHNKKMNRKLEFKLAETEWLASAAMQKGAAYPAEQLYENWETVLRNQFHDIIPGSSIREVYEDSTLEYAGVDESLDVLQAKALQALTTPEENTWSVVNFSSFDRCEPVLIPAEGCGHFVDAENHTLCSQKTDDGYLVQLPCQALSLTSVKFIPGDHCDAESALSCVSDGCLTNDRYIIHWDAAGHLTRIYDKEYDREVLAQGQFGNVLEVFEDKPMRYDAWDIDIYYTQKKEEFRLTKPAELIENSALRTVLRFTYQYNISALVQDVTFYRDSRRIDFVTDVDWHEDHRLLKTAFGVNLRATRANYDIQFGYADRPTHANTSWDMARFEVCGHKWSDISESNYGVSLLSESKYGYNTDGNVMKMSLLKSSKAPDLTADMGAHHFTYALFPHGESVAKGGTIEESTAFNLPLRVFPGRAAMHPFITLTGDGVNLDCCKLSRDGKSLVVRVHECRGGKSAFTLTCEGMKAYQTCNFIEDVTETDVKTDGNRIEDRLKAFQIKTYRLFPES